MYIEVRLPEALVRYFPNEKIKPEEVVKMEWSSVIVEFPRARFCKCTRCTSTGFEPATIAVDLTVTTDRAEFYVRLPGPDHAFLHPMEGE